MRIALALAAVALALAAPAQAGWTTVTLAPVEDVGIPYWCSWGYDWDERCYRDDSTRLPVGGVDDKLWRSALRFALPPIPSDAVITGADLALWFDGTCVAPRRTLTRCPARRYELGAHPVYTERWRTERELIFGPLVAAVELDTLAAPGWVEWDLTELGEEWVEAGLANNGVLVKLADAQEGYGSSGPAFASSSFADPTKSPRLVVTYWR
jgi:hypothetical protein